MSKSVIGGMFRFWLNIGSTFNRLKNEPEKQPTSKQLGIRSIVNSVIGAVFLIGFMFAIAYLIKISSSGDNGLGEILIIVGIVICALLAVVALINGLFNGLMCAIYQKRLNKLAIGNVAIGIWVTFFVLAIVATILFFVLL